MAHGSGREGSGGGGVYYGVRRIGGGIGGIEGNAGREFANDVFRGGDAFRKTVADERIGSKASGTKDVSGHGENLLSEIEGELGGNEASRRQSGFSDERAVGIAGDQGVADGKMVRERSGSGRKRGDDGSRRIRDRVEKPGVGAGVVDIDARSDERDGRSTGFQSGQMGRGIDSRSPSGNDRRAVADEIPHETGSHFFAVRRSLS